MHPHEYQGMPGRDASVHPHEYQGMPPCTRMKIKACQGGMPPCTRMDTRACQDGMKRGSASSHLSNHIIQCKRLHIAAKRQKAGASGYPPLLHRTFGTPLAGQKRDSIMNSSRGVFVTSGAMVRCGSHAAIPTPCDNRSYVDPLTTETSSGRQGLACVQTGPNCGAERRIAPFSRDIFAAPRHLPASSSQPLPPADACLRMNAFLSAKLAICSAPELGGALAVSASSLRARPLH